MQATPARLTPKRYALLKDPPSSGDQQWDGIVWSRGHVLRRLRVFRRALLALTWTLLLIPVQLVLLVLPGHAKVALPRLYWAGMCRVLGLEVRVIGAAAHRSPAGRPVVFVANHSSWLDVLVLGATLDACFIAKEEVAGWPVISWVAGLGRTVYVRRRRTSTARERDEMRRRLARGDNLVLFPEGTTSDGSRVMSFRSAFLSVALLPATPDGKPPIVQPVSVAYDRLAFLPAGRSSRPLFAWYGDMDIATHFWRLAQHRGLRASVLLHAPVDPASYPGRKELGQALWTTVADGAATLRQNRPAEPIAAAGSTDAAAPAPAYA